jgi:hypothetical protein
MVSVSFVASLSLAVKQIYFVHHTHDHIIRISILLSSLLFALLQICSCLQIKNHEMAVLILILTTASMAGNRMRLVSSSLPRRLERSIVAVTNEQSTYFFILNCLFQYVVSSPWSCDRRKPPSFPCNTSTVPVRTRRHEVLFLSS